MKMLQGIKLIGMKPTEYLQPSSLQCVRLMRKACLSLKFQIQGYSQYLFRHNLLKSDGLSESARHFLDKLMAPSFYKIRKYRVVIQVIATSDLFTSKCKLRQDSNV